MKRMILFLATIPLCLVLTSGVEAQHQNKQSAPQRKASQSPQSTKQPTANQPDHKSTRSPSPPSQIKHSVSVQAVQFSSNGKTLATWGADKVMRLWDLQTGKLIQTLTELGDSVAFAGMWGAGAFRISPDARTLATWGANKEVKLWDLQTGKLKRTLAGHEFDVFAVAFSPDSKTMATADGQFYRASIQEKSGAVRLWDAETGELKWTQEGPTALVCSVAFSPDGKTLASGHVEIARVQPRVLLWDVQTGKTKQDQERPFVFSVVFSPDGKMLAGGSVGSASLSRFPEAAPFVQLWDAETLEIKQTLKDGSFNLWPGATTVAFSLDGRTLVSYGEAAIGLSGEKKEKIRIWDVQAGKVKQTLEEYGPIAFTPDLKTFASRSDDKTVVKLSHVE